MPEPAPRPAQVTLAAWLVMGGSLAVVLASFDQIAGLHTLETRHAVEAFLDDDLGRSLGLDVSSTLSLMRVLTMVAAACATAAAILGYQVLQRSRSARLVLTVLATPIFLSGVAVGGIVPSMVAGAIVMLWFQPARDWVDGKTPRPVPVAPPSPSLPVAAPPPPPPVTPPGDAEPRPVSGFGDRPSLLDSLPPPRTAPVGAAPLARSSTRPQALVWGCVLAWFGAAFTCLTMIVLVVVMVASPDAVVDEMKRQDPTFFDHGVTIDSFRASILFGGSLLAVWALVAIVLAAYAWRGRPWAWTGLVVSASLATLMCLVSAVTSPAFLLALAYCAVASVLLLRPEVREFINR